MPAPTIVLNNGTADLTFALTDALHGVAIYQHRIDGRPDLSYQLKFSNPRGANGRKGQIELTYPITQMIDGKETLVELAREKFVIPVPDVATAADRSEITSLIKAVASNTSVMDYFTGSVGV